MLLSPCTSSGTVRAWPPGRSIETFVKAGIAESIDSNGSPLVQSQVFAVNLMTAESDLTRISRDELQNEVWPGIPIGYETSWQGEGTPRPLSAAATWQLHVGLFYAVVALLLLESILAWRFGYNAR